MAEEFLKEKIEMIAEGLEYMDKVIIQVEDVCEILLKFDQLLRYLLFF